MNKIRIALFDSKPYDKLFFEKLSVQSSFNFEIHFFPNHLTEDTAILTAGFDCVCVFVNDHVSPRVIDILQKNRISLLALRCAGYNNVDLKYAYKRVHVVRVPAYSPYAVAEHAVALMMTLNRKTHKAYFRTRDSNFTLNGLLGFDMRDKTAGVIGTGKIGKVVIEILKGFGMKILAFDTYPDFHFAKENNVQYVELNQLYRESDIITLHCPLTPENIHLINRVSINEMKDGVMIINTGRGKLIHTKDLIHGLKNHKIGSAGLDVYEEESDYFFEDFSAEAINDDILARLLTFPNVLITSHQAFFTKEALIKIGETTLDNIQLYFNENKLPNEICYKCSEGVCVKQTTGRCF
jgi:D-lactate dehydrogenase